MKKNVILLSISTLLLFGIIGYFVLHAAKLTPSQPSPAPTTTSGMYCKPDALQAEVSLSPGAGNVYGTFTLKNISATSCKVLGGKFIEAHFTNPINNIAITHIGQTQEKPFSLQAGQTLYSQIHYPNGPQCQSIGITSIPVRFTYQISPSNTVDFTSVDPNNKPIVQACKAPADMTTIEIWNMATEPITR